MSVQVRQMKVLRIWKRSYGQPDVQPLVWRRQRSARPAISQEGFVIATYQSVERSQKIEVVFSPGELNERIPARLCRRSGSGAAES